MGFIDYYNAENLTEALGTGEHLAAWVDSIGRKRPKHKTDDLNFIPPKNIWKIPAWEKGFYNSFKTNVRDLNSEIYELEEILKAGTDKATTEKGDSQKIFAEIETLQNSVDNSVLKMEEYMSLPVNDMRFKYKDEAVQFFKDQYRQNVQQIRKIQKMIYTSSLLPQTKKKMSNKLNEIEKDIRYNSEVYKIHLKQVLTPVQTNSTAGHTRKALEYTDDYEQYRDVMEKMLNHFGSNIAKYSRNPSSYSIENIKNDYEKLDQLKNIPTAFQDLQKDIEDDDSVLETEKSVLSMLINGEINRINKYTPKFEEFLTKVQSDYEEAQAQAQAQAQEQEPQPEEQPQQDVQGDKVITNPDEIKAKLDQYRKRATDFAKPNGGQDFESPVPQKAKPLAGKKISPEKRREIADRRLQNRQLNNSYRFEDHYLSEDERPLAMNLNEESPYLINRIVGNAMGAVGKGLGGLAGLAMGAIKSKLNQKPKVRQAMPSDLNGYLSKGRVFNVPYGGYVATNAGCAQSLAEFTILKKQKGMISAKTMAMTTAVVVDREGVEIDDDIKGILAQYIKLNPDVTGALLIEGTLWKTSNKGVIFAGSILMNPDEEDANDAQSKSNAMVQIDQDERQDMMFVVGCDPKGEKFFIDNYQMSMRQYLQNVKGANKNTLTKQSETMHKKFSELGLTDVKGSMKRMMQKQTTNPDEFKTIYDNFRAWASDNIDMNRDVTQIDNQKRKGGIYNISKDGVNGEVQLYVDVTPQGNVYNVKFTPNLADLFKDFDPNGIENYKQL